MKLSLPYPPSVNTMYATVRGRRVLSREGREFKEKVGILARIARVQAIEGDITLSVALYRPRRSGDLDNRLKAIMDSLTGIAYADDGQVRKIIAERFEDPKFPRVEIEVEGFEPKSSPSPAK